jgi:hypothetical protein
VTGKIHFTDLIFWYLKTTEAIIEGVVLQGALQVGVLKPQGWYFKEKLVKLQAT